MPDDDLRGRRRRRGYAAPRLAAGASYVLLRGAAGIRHRLLDTRPRTRREGVRFRRHGCPQRCHGGDHGRDGISAVEDPFSGNDNIYTALADKPAPEKLLAELGSSYAVFGTTIKKWTVGSPLQSVLDSVAALLDDPGVRADTIKHIRVDMPTASLRIVDNSTSPISACSTSSP